MKVLGPIVISQGLLVMRYFAISDTFQEQPLVKHNTVVWSECIPDISWLRKVCMPVKYAHHSHNLQMTTEGQEPFKRCVCVLSGAQSHSEKVSAQSQSEAFSLPLTPLVSLNLTSACSLSFSLLFR